MKSVTTLVVVGGLGHFRLPIAHCRLTINSRNNIATGNRKSATGTAAATRYRVVILTSLTQGGTIVLASVVAD